MTQSPSPLPPTPPPRRRRWFVCLAAVSLLGLGCALACIGALALNTIDRVEERLVVTPQITGAPVTVTGIAWYGEQGITPWFTPIADLAIEVEVHNPTAQALEVVQTQIIAHDPLGRTAASAVFRYGSTAPNGRILVYPGETRPLSGGGVLLPYPLTWTSATLQVDFKPAAPETLSEVVRWDDLVVQTETAHPDGSFTFEGSSAAAEKRAGGIDARPAAVVSFYNAEGRFVRGRSWAMGGSETVQVSFAPDEVPLGPVTHARVFFVEAYGPPLPWSTTPTPP